jgi:DNA-binding XRE family transcriptional regulator
VEASPTCKHKLPTILGRCLFLFLFLYWLVSAKTDSRKLLGETIRAYREAAHLSQEKLAELADLSRNFVGAVERGEDTISVEALVRVAKALRVRARDLVSNL